MKKLAIFTGFLVSIPALVMAQGLGGGPCGFGGFCMHRYFGFGGGIFMWIVTIVVVGLLVFSGIRLFKNQTCTAGEDPLKVLKTRYAKGEITKEQFEAMKKDIL